MKTKVMVGMLTLGNINILTAGFLFDLLKKTNLDITIFNTNREDVSRGRNHILQKFLDSDNEYLLFLDEDNPPEDLNFLNILIDDNKDIVSGLVPSRTPTGDGTHCLCIFSEKEFLDGSYGYVQYLNVPEGDDVFRIANCGMGCVLLRRRVVENVMKNYSNPCMMGEYWYYRDGDTILKEENIDLYKLKDGLCRFKRFMSEDLIFFERARTLGYQIFADKRVTCSHIGNADIVRVSSHIIGRNFNKELTTN